MSHDRDPRVVLTLDAGGTNFVFSALRSNREVVEPFTLPSNAHELGACLDTMVEGFSAVRDQAPDPPAAISFAFPGPADFPLGIIGDVANLPGFEGGGVALGPMLEERFGVPVFLNNDGDLFTLGEAMAGFLPWVNGLLQEAGSPRRFRNLFGATLGTGFGGGIVGDGRLWVGDNSAAGEIWLTRDKLNSSRHVEEAASIRGVRRVYAREAGLELEDTPEPREIFAIATGDRPGNRLAALEAFRSLGEAAGDALADALNLIDGLVVIGGGLAGAADLFLPALVEEMKAPYRFADGGQMRMETRAFNLENADERANFLAGEIKTIPVPGSTRTVTYDPLPRVGVGLSRLGTSRAVALGAYAFALGALDARPR